MEDPPMRIIGPPEYKPDVTCLHGPPFCGEEAYKSRMAHAQALRLQNARWKREAQLRCPECGDGMKVRLFGRWFCRHCLMEMTRHGRL